MVKYLSEIGGVMLTSVFFSASVQAIEANPLSTPSGMAKGAIATAVNTALFSTTGNQQSLVNEARTLTAQQSGPISDINTFGVLPQPGDLLDAGTFTVTIDQAFSAGLIDDAQGTVALKGEFVVGAGVILTVNGDWDASHADTQNQLKTGGQIQFDGQSGVTRSYIASSGYYRAPSLLIDSTKADKAFFGLKLGSSASFVYNKQGFLGSNIQGGNVHLNGFSSGYIHDGYDRAATKDCIMPNVLFTNSGTFHLRFFASDSGTCDMQNLTILSPTASTAFSTGGSGTPSQQGAAFNLNGLSVDGNVEYYSRPEFLMNDWVVRDLSATLPMEGWQDVDSWLLFNVNNIPVGSDITSNIYFRAEKFNPHGFRLATDWMTGRSERTIDSVVFEFNNTGDSESGDMYALGGPGELNETIRITNNIALKNTNGHLGNTFATFNGSDQNGRKLELSNNVVYVPAGNRSISLNEASQTPAGTISSVKDNIFWSDVEQPGYVVDSLGSTSQTDILSAGAYVNNGVYNARTDGEHVELDLPLSYTPEAPVTTNPPRFHDDTRRLETYGASQLELDGTAESAFTAFVTRHLTANDIARLGTMSGHEDYVTTHKGVLAVKDLIDWVKQGFVATTTTYHTTASDAGALGLSVAPDFVMNDSDGDTVDDAFDHCGNTPLGGVIDEHGCTDVQNAPQHLVAVADGPISAVGTFLELPKDGDTLDAGNFTVTVDQNFSAGDKSNAAGVEVLKGEFVVEAGVTLTVNGDWDASQNGTQNVLKTGAHIEFDGELDVVRNYKAAGNHYYAPSLLVDASKEDKAFFGLKPGSTAQFVYDKGPYYGSNIMGGNVHLNGFSTGYIHDGYNTANTRVCDMPNVLMTNSGRFMLRYSGTEQGSCDYSNLTILSPTVESAFVSGGGYSNTLQGEQFNLNGLSVDGGVEYYARSEFLMNDWVLRDLAATLPAGGWQNIDGWLLFNADTLPMGSAKMSNIYFRDDKFNPHGFGMGRGYLTKHPVREMDSVVFDFINDSWGESGDMYLSANAETMADTVRITNNIGLRNLGGKQSSTFVTFGGSGYDNRNIELSNNVVYIPYGNRAVSLNEAGMTPDNVLSKVNDNIFWGRDDNPGYVVDSLTATSAEDIMSVGAYSNNGVFNALTDGEHGELDLPLSVNPQAPVTTADPRFYDESRRLETYGEQVLGLDGTADSAFNAFVTRHLSDNDIAQLTSMGGHEALVAAHQPQVLVVKDMIDWIKQGFLATTTTYHSSGSNNSTLGLQATSNYTMVDSDGDTIDDYFDSCDNSPAGEAIDINGCANSELDDDGDFVMNDVDLCPETPAGATLSERGCSLEEIQGELVGFKSWGIGGGGAMAGYSINPFDDTMRFVGTDMGTAFRSLNSGTNWAPIRHTQTTYHAYLGYAAGFGFASKYAVMHAPQGLNPVRSINGGQNFSTPASFTLNDSKNERITGWYSDTLNEGTVYAMTTEGLWRSTDEGNNWTFVYNGGSIKGMFIDNQQSGKVYIATENEILKSTDGVNYVNHFTPFGHKIHRFSGGSDDTLRTLTYASDETQAAQDAAFAAGLVQGEVLAMYERPSNAGFEVSAALIYVSKDDGDFELTDQFMGSHLSMAQNDPQTIYATGTRKWGRDKGTSVYVSENGGDNWSLKFLQLDWDAGFTPWEGSKLEHSPVGLNVGWHDGGYYTVGINQSDSSQFGGSGNYFLHGTENTGEKWLDLTNEYKGTTADSPVKTDKWVSGGLNVTGVYDVQFHPANGNDIYAASADIHGVRSTDHGASWQILHSDYNSIYDYAFHPTDENTVYMVNGSHHDWPFRELTVNGSGSVYKSTNKGNNWTRLMTEHSVLDRQYLSVAFDSANSTLYAGSHGDGVVRSSDDGQSWEVINDGLPGTFAGHNYTMELVIPQIEVVNGKVYALVSGVRPELTEAEVTELGLTANQYIKDTSGATTKYYSWINQDRTGIYVLNDTGATPVWEPLRGTVDTASHGNWHSTHLPWKRPTKFAVDPNNANVMYLIDIEDKTWQARATGIWKTVDAGVTWTFVEQHTNPLDIDIDPTNSNYVIVTGPTNWDNGGACISKDGGATWTLDTRPALQNNNQSVAFDPQNPGKVVYGYFGGGMLFGDKL